MTVTMTTLRLRRLKKELDDLYFSAEYDRLRSVIDDIRGELIERKNKVKVP